PPAETKSPHHSTGWGHGPETPLRRPGTTAHPHGSYGRRGNLPQRRPQNVLRALLRTQPGQKLIPRATVDRALAEPVQLGPGERVPTPRSPLLPVRPAGVVGDLPQREIEADTGQRRLILRAGRGHTPTVDTRHQRKGHSLCPHLCLSASPYRPAQPTPRPAAAPSPAASRPPPG